MAEKESLDDVSITPAPAGSSTESAPDPEPRNPSEGKQQNRDKWDYIEILLRPFSVFLTALTVALIGWFGQQALDNRAREETIRARQAQTEETKRTELAQNYRLYTELLSKREDAESALRKDMFSTILKEFFQIRDSGNGHRDVPKRLLKLEILALNFGEALRLSPLFIELDKDIDQNSYPPETAKEDRTRDRKRLHSLARRVSLQQLSALSTGGRSWEFAIPIEDMKSGKPYQWPCDEDERKSYEDELEGIKRNYTFSFSQADEDYKSVVVEIEIQTTGKTKAIEREFELNYFNFPMVDNTRLSDDQRFALIMTDFQEKAIHFAAICFPGKYSSQRDKPFLDDVIHRLQDKALRTLNTGKKPGSGMEGNQNDQP